jgi:hypothetical protein
MSSRSREKHLEHEKGRRLSDVTEDLQIASERFDLYRYVVTQDKERKVLSYAHRFGR